MKTGHTILAEATVDEIWGIGIDIGDPAVNDSNNWIGLNRLGRVLMEIRSRWL